MKQYYYVNAQGQKMPPIDASDLKAAGVTPQTLVWCEGMANWQRACDVEELQPVFGPQAVGFGMGATMPMNGGPRPGMGGGYGSQPGAPYQPGVPPYQPGAPTQPPFYQNPGPYGPQQQPYGAQPYGAPQQPMRGRPQNWLWLGILSTILCCLPFGIASIVYASKVNGCWDSGDYDGAYKNANNAQMWGWISVGTGLIVGFISFAQNL